MSAGLRSSNRATLAVVGGGTLLTAMAGSAVALALPALGAEFQIPLDRASWVILAFVLAVTVLLLAAGRAGDMFGHQRVYLCGFGLFGLASVVCGIAPSLAVLIAGRVAQGVGGAMVMATGPALLTTSIPGARRGQALGLVSSATYVGLSVGPPLGGLIIAGLGWRWVFLINVPICLLILGAGLFCLPSSTRNDRAVRPNAAGLLTLICGLPLLLLALNRGNDWGWASPRTLGCAAAGAALLASFAFLQLRRANPLLDLGMFKSKVFSGAVLAALGNYVALFVQTILLPYYLVQGLGDDPAQAGIVLAAQPVVMALCALPAGWLSDRIGSRGLAIGGMLIMACGLFGLSSVHAESSALGVAGWLALMGLGTGVFISPNSSALMGAAPAAAQGAAGGVMALARNLGMMIGISVAGVIFSAAGGSGGAVWRDADYRALSIALCCAAGVALLAALASAVRPDHLRRGGA